MFLKLCYPKSEKLELFVDGDSRGAKEARNILNVMSGVSQPNSSFSDDLELYEADALLNTSHISNQSIGIFLPESTSKTTRSSASSKDGRAKTESMT